MTPNLSLNMKANEKQILENAENLRREKPTFTNEKN